MKGTREQLEIAEPHQLKKILGVYLDMDSTNETHIKYMWRVTKQWYDSDSKHPIRVGTWVTLNITVLYILEYPLLALNLAEKDCSSSMALILNGGSPKVK